MNGFDPEALHAYVEGGFVEQPDGSVTLACHPEDEARLYEMSRHSGAYDGLSLVTCPVVVARGRIDEGGLAQWADEVATTLPHGRLEPHDELGHFGPMEDPAGVAAAVQRVLDAE
jgi:pimeloyl-ACP methyl ester carboxylesterase